MNRPANSSIPHPGTELYDVARDEIVNEPSVPAPDVAGPKPGLLKRLVRRFSVLGLIGLVMVVFWLTIAVIGPWIAPYKSGALSSMDVFAGSSHAFPLGTDYLGRDMLSRILYGTRYTVGLALAAALLASLIGTFFGLVAAVSGR